MFEVTPRDIALLGDEDLRTLVARLCEAEVKSCGFSISRVTWGGHQNAADGGIDVRVALPHGTTINGFVPRPTTGIQAKKSDMNHSAILAEMRPNGVLRPAIEALADVSGAYIIASSTSSTSDSASQNRLKAMADATNDICPAGTLTLKFYDGRKLASWVGEHPGLTLWVREKVGRSMVGWQPYGAWACPAEGTSATYLIDEKARFRTGKHETRDGMDIATGIEQIRNALRVPGLVVRLIGLSGVGKTRLAQALFDSRIGENGLTPQLAIYTNVAEGPNPQPLHLARELFAKGQRAILVIDNCQPELHRGISAICGSEGSLVSAITIEHDVQDDQPEGTEVFELMPSSAKTIETLIAQKFPSLSLVNARRIAEGSDGNARIAIALAGTVGRNETIVGLNDKVLFERLFLQGHSRDQSLYITAQACSLLYSFQGEDTSEQSEIAVLASLVGQSPSTVFRNIAELRRRDLVQKRSVWRAVLPQAMAHQLAATCLEELPFAAIHQKLVCGTERILKSFSHRLKFLHGSREAADVVTAWLAPKGLLGNVADLTDIQKEILQNVAPVAPEAALLALERELCGNEDYKVALKCCCYAHLLRLLAYDATMFKRSAVLIARIASAPSQPSTRNEAREIFVSLFLICLSGTHASITQRLQLADSLLRSQDANQRDLGLSALNAALEAQHFLSHYGFQFGDRSRDHGYWPSNNEDIKEWYRAALELARIIAGSDLPSAKHVRRIVAERFCGLWFSLGIQEDLYQIAITLSESEFWPEGWIAIREALQLDANGQTTEPNERLFMLEKRLRPGNLLQEVQSIVFAAEYTIVDLGDGEQRGEEEAGYERTERRAHSLGIAVASDESALAELLPNLVCTRGRLHTFGQGLAEGSPEPHATWAKLVAQLEVTPLSARNIDVLRGFLQALASKNPNLTNHLLDCVLENDFLVVWYPTLQAAAGIGSQGVARVERALSRGRTPIAEYDNLAWRPATESIPANELRRLLRVIASQIGGWKVAVEILSTWTRSEIERKQTYAPETLEIGRELLAQVDFTNGDERNDSGDYSLGTIVEACLADEQSSWIARGICVKLQTAISQYKTFSTHHSALLQSLFSTQPHAAMDIFYAPEPQGRLVHDFRGLRGSLLDKVPEKVILDWCDLQPSTRYPRIAAVVTAYTGSHVGTVPTWTKIARQLFYNSPEKVAVLEQFVCCFEPDSGSGSRASIIESNATLLDEWHNHSDLAIRSFVDEQKLRLTKVVAAEVRQEATRTRERDERFE